MIEVGQDFCGRGTVSGFVTPGISACHQRLQTLRFGKPDLFTAPLALPRCHGSRNSAGFP
jgi:hypothetical protein